MPLSPVDTEHIHARYHDGVRALTRPTPKEIKGKIAIEAK
jgi:hypothetical protein